MESHFDQMGTFFAGRFRKDQGSGRQSLAAALAVNILAFALFGACSGSRVNSASYEFASVRRATVERTVSSSGTINPVATVRVLPRMSGKVERIFVDFNDYVSAGDILAELNTDMLRLRHQQQYAAVLRARANHELQLHNYRSQQALAARNLISDFELKTARTTLNNLAADLAVAEANLQSIETEINQFAFITSPIDGIVLARNINVGDTVVDSSSNNSTSIFTLAENMREMQIEALVSELDVTSIYRGQAVRFTLESMPGRRFSGVVETLRMIPVVSNNVVSYTVIINVENHDGSLLPGMTCAVEFIVQRSENVLTVPNAALRYQPSNLSAERIAEMIFNASLADMNDEQRQAAIAARAQPAQAGTQNQPAGIAGLMAGSQQPGARMTGGSRQSPNPRQGAAGGSGRNAGEPVVIRNLWYINGEGQLGVMQVQTGITNGSFTEIIAPQDIEGKQIILRERI